MTTKEQKDQNSIDSKGVSDSTAANQRTDAEKRLVLFALLSWIATVTVSVFYPLDRPVDELTDLSFFSAYAWVVTQAFAPIAAILFPFLLFTRLSPSWAWRLGAFALYCVPTVLLLDCITFHWIGERFLSSTMLHISLSLLPGLLPFLGIGTIVLGLAMTLALIVLLGTGMWLAGRLSSRWSVTRSGDLSPLTAALLLTVGSGFLAIPALRRRQATVGEMRSHSIRHPLCAFRIVGYRNVGVSIPKGADSIDAQLHGLGLADAVTRRVQQFNQAELLPARETKELPDIVLVIMESLQHSMITPEVMPNAYQLSQKGYLMRHHFSGGNASNLGIFSLLNGVEASYFPHADRFTPLANHLLPQAGYELGFYGGTDDWVQFGMGDFIKPQYYREFEIEPVDWIDSDQRSIDRALRFLQPDRSIRGPRMAVVYLYSSHLPFAMLPDHKVFLPSASDNYVAPYTREGRTAVWNRYRNAVHSLDHMMRPLLREDRVVVVVGDHGESFMDDGTIGHGTRLSRIQNTTSAMVYLPGTPPRVFDEMTTHADLLPTLLPALALKTQSADLFEGVDLSSIRPEQLKSRRLATFHYMWPETVLAGPWTADAGKPWGYRFAFSTDKWQLAPLNPVDDQGLEWEGEADLQPELAEEMDRWLKNRFGVNPTLEEADRITLFRRYLRSEDAEVRKRAVEIAELESTPEPELLQLLSKTAADESRQVRDKARQVIIRLRKRMHD